MFRRLNSENTTGCRRGKVGLQPQAALYRRDFQTRLGFCAYMHLVTVHKPE